MHETDRTDNRKLEFMQTALELFYEKGYDNTTIKDIIDHMGVSKGAFYHYFESKEDVIVSLAKSFTDKAVKLIKTIFARTDLTTIEKMNEVFSSMNAFKFKEREWRTKFHASMESEENLKLQYKIIHYVKQDVVCLYEELIDAGVKDGTIKNPVNTREMAELFIHTMFTLNTSVYELECEIIKRGMEDGYKEFLFRMGEKVQFYEVMLERMLQLEEGSIDLCTAYMKRFKPME